MKWFLKEMEIHFLKQKVHSIYREFLGCVNGTYLTKSVALQRPDPDLTRYA
jgi:hypothetical protein